MSAQPLNKNVKLFAISIPIAIVVAAAGYFVYPFFYRDGSSTTTAESIADIQTAPDAREQIMAIPMHRSALTAEENNAQIEKIYAKYQDPLVGNFLGMSSGGFRVASRAAEKIYDRGSEADIEFLFSILYLEKPEGFSVKEWQAMQSRSLDYLVDEWSQHRVAEERLIAMLGDATVPDFVKNQIVAHSDVMYEHSEDPQKLEALLWQTSTQYANDIASTALASLAKISHRSHTIDIKRLSMAANNLTRSAKSSTQNRVVAMEVANWLKSPEVYLQALDILQGDKFQPEIMQLAAINTLVVSGKREGIPLLEKIALSDEPTLKRAAIQAIALLEGE